jgi:hypothetical protein
VSALGWLVALIAAVGALALPFARGVSLVLALTPFANAYGSAAATAIVVARWCIVELPGRTMTRPVIRKVVASLLFLLSAIVVSGFVAGDLLRLASESAQWVIGVGLFIALVIGGRSPHEASLVRSLIAGGALLAGAHILMRTFGIHVDDSATLPFMISDGNNYAALFLLVALVILPAHPAARISTPAYLSLAVLGFTGIVLHDSRAQEFIACMVVGGVLLLRHTTPRVAIATVMAGAAIVMVVLLHFLRESFFSNSSVLSLANFQTNYSNLERLGLILHSLQFFAANPLGAGLGASSDVFPNSPFTIGSYPTPHNTFAQLIVELGWLGLIAYVTGMIVFVRAGIRDCLAGQPFGIAALAAVGLSVIDAVFFNGSVSLLFWVLLGLVQGSAATYRGARIPMLFERTA